MEKAIQRDHKVVGYLFEEQGWNFNKTIVNPSVAGFGLDVNQNDQLPFMDTICCYCGRDDYIFGSTARMDFACVCSQGRRNIFPSVF